MSRPLASILAVIAPLLAVAGCGGGSDSSFRLCFGEDCPVTEPDTTPSNLSIFGFRGARDTSTQILPGAQAQLYRTAGTATGTASFGGRVEVTPGSSPRDRISVSMGVDRPSFGDFCCVYVDNTDRTDALGGAFDTFQARPANVFDPDSVAAQSRTTVTIRNTDFGGSGLQHTTYGFWELERFDPFGDLTALRATAFAFGYRTPLDAIPQAGSATYSGRMDARYVAGLAPATPMTGSFTLTTDFTTRRFEGSVTGLDLAGTPFRDIDLDGTLPGGTSLNGTATTAPALGGQTGPDMAGTVLGDFYGPAAAELGAVMVLQGGGAQLVGAIAGKR
jgi:hypothetical protein